ncbi:MAG: mannitol dehydrogenase family protein [Streptosporangiaceae bacterium]
MSTTGRRLSRERDGRPAPPVRIAHLGLGNFFRAHQAACTDQAADAAQWGIAAFTGRSAGPAGDLAAQDGLYTLLVRGPEADRPQVISALSRVAGSAWLGGWREVFALPGLAVVTLTVTEAGYHRAPCGGLDLADPEVAADVAALRARPPGALRTAPGKLVAGFQARQAAGLGPVSVVPCDNVPGNGAMTRRVVGDLAAEADPRLAAWIGQHVSYVTTMVDRITPRATHADRAGLLAASGIDDPACVVTEPFSEWVLSGDFAAGRPGWESAGARFTADLEPWENRKLWLLNGSHSLLAYAGSIRGADTVAQAIGDPLVRGWVGQWWDDAQRHLPLPAAEIAAYRSALLDRFGNPRIRHLLAQIAADGSQKIPIRILPVLRAELAAGRVPAGATRVVAAWVLHLRGIGAPVTDPAAAGLRAGLAHRPLAEAAAAVLDALGLRDDRVRRAVTEQARELSGEP